MKTTQKINFAFVLYTLFSSCQSGEEVTQILSKPGNRKMIMDSIANNSEMSLEIIETIWNSKNGIMMRGDSRMMGRFLGNHEGMMNLIRHNPMLMQNLISNMMDADNIDSSMMNSMYNIIMRNREMIDMKQNMNEGNGNMNKLDRMNNGRMINEGMNK